MNNTEVSVAYLSGHFLQEVKDAGFEHDNATAYDLEPDVSSRNLGFIRQKGGEHVTCSTDNKSGGAFVDCLDGKDCIGPANNMLNYTWDDNMYDIVKTLLGKYKEEKMSYS